MRRSLAAPIVLALGLVTASQALLPGCEADRVAFSSCTSSTCCDRNCAIDGHGGPVLEPTPPGALAFADVARPAIYRLSPFGGLERVAGTGEPGESPDGVPATLAAIGPPEILGLDSADGGLVFRDLATGATRKIDAFGILRTTLPPRAR